MKLYITAASPHYELLCKQNGFRPTECDDIASVKRSLSLLCDKNWDQIFVYQSVRFADICEAFGVAYGDKRIVVYVDKSDLTSRDFNEVIAVKQYSRKDGKIDPLSVKMTTWLNVILARAA